MLMLVVLNRCCFGAAWMCAATFLQQEARMGMLQSLASTMSWSVSHEVPTHAQHVCDLVHVCTTLMHACLRFSTL